MGLIMQWVRDRYADMNYTDLESFIGNVIRVHYISIWDLVNQKKFEMKSKGFWICPGELHTGGCGSNITPAS